MSVKIWNEDTQQWEVVASNKATTISLLDLKDNYESDNVEGALREIGDVINNQVPINTKNIASLDAKIKDHINNHPSGTGSALPTIESDFEIDMAEATEQINIPIYFVSPNLGEGICYVNVNNIEIKTQTIEQGDSIIKIPALGSGTFVIELKVKDRNNTYSNKLKWTVVCGGIDIKLLSNYNSFIPIGTNITFDYEIITDLKDVVTLYLTLNDEEQIIETSNGKHSIDIPDLTLGVHKISYYATVSKYKTKVYTNNIVITNSDSLYLSSNTDSSINIIEGNPVVIDYCVSKVSEEDFTIIFTLDDVITKGTCKSGTYTWSNNTLKIGTHKLNIEVIDSDRNTASLVFTIVIEEDTEFESIKCSEYKLLAWWDASDNKNNLYEDRNIWKDKISGIEGTLHNFNYSSNGWMSNTETNEYWLECNGTSYVEIPYAPFKDNFKNGGTIDILFKVSDVGDVDARVLDITDNTNKSLGCYINTYEACLMSESHSSSVVISEDEYVRVTYVIDRTNNFGIVYVDGIPTDGFVLTYSELSSSIIMEDFSHNNYIYLNSIKGKGYGSCCIKQLRIYDRALTHNEVITVDISDIEDKQEQKEKYSFNFDNKTIPKMYLTFNKNNLDSDKNNKIPLSMIYDSPNTDEFGNGFTSSKCYIYAQGTSSLGFVVPNFNIVLRDEAGNDMYFNPFKGTAKAETLFCLKANYMDSSNIDNIALAQIANECLYDEDTYNPAQIKDMQENDLDKPQVRHTVMGFPIYVYVKDTSQENAQFEVYGLYDFNTDRYSANTFGYSQYEDGECLSYEVAANTQTGAGAFNAWTSDSGKTETQYYKDEFKLIHPLSREGKDDYAEIKRLVNFVSSAGIENFKSDLPNYFNTTHLIRYYIFVNLFGLVDSLGKNMKITSFEIDSNGNRIWYPQLYDMDTCLGLNNEGLIKFDVDIEPEHDSTVEDDNTAFNTSASKLWVKLHDFMWDEIKQEYQYLRTNKLTLENIMYYIYDLNIAKIPKTYYAESMQQKYLNFKQDYLTVMHGSRYHHIKKWIKERLLYMDTLMGFDAAVNDYVTIRAQAMNTVNIELEPYSPMYIKVKWTNAGDEDSQAYSTVRVRRGETASLSTVLSSNDQEVMIYGGQYIKRLKNLTSLKPKSLLLSAATRLIDLECHSPILSQLAINKCKVLQNVDINGCANLGTDSTSAQILDLTGCTNLRYVDIYDTQLQGVITDTTGGNLEEIYYPYSTQTIELYNQNNLKVVGIPTEIIYDKQINHSLNKFANKLNRIKLYNCENVETIRKEYSDYNYFEDYKFLPLYYTKTIDINNSLNGLNIIDLSYCNSLTSLGLNNLDNLNILNLNNLNVSSGLGSLKLLDIVGCTNLERVNINYDNSQITNDIYYPSFANNFILDLSSCKGLKTVYSNYPIKGIKNIILPTYKDDDTEQIISNIKDIIFINNSSSNTKSSIETIYTRYSDEEYKDNIDLKDIILDNLILQTVDVPTKITNLYLNISVPDNININKYRNQNNQIDIYGTYDFSNFQNNNMNSLFKGLDLTNITLKLNNQLDSITDLSSCFEDCTVSANTDLNNFISKFNNVITFNKTFKNARGLSNSLPINFSKTKYAIEMFYNCDFSSINNYDLSNIENTSYMFYGCDNLILDDSYTINLNSCINNNYMFYGCSSLTNINFENDNNIESSIYTFANCINLISIALYNTSKVKDMSYIFYNCKNMLNIPDLNTDSVLKINYGFYNCRELLGTADPNKYWLNDNISEYALCFANCSKLDNFYTEPPDGVPDEWGGLYDSIGENDMEIKIISNDSTYPLSNFLPLFYSSYSHNLLNTNYSAWQIYSNSDIDICLIEPINVSDIEQLTFTSNKSQTLSVIAVDKNNNYLSTIVNITDTMNLTFNIPSDCSYINILFRYGSFDKIKENDSKLINANIENNTLEYEKMSITKTDGSISTDTSIPISNVSSIYIKFNPETMFIDFANNNYIESISSIDLSNCPICDYMFSNCENLKRIESLNIENVKSMVGTFYNCRKLETINGIDTSQCNDISDIFYNCIKLYEVPEFNFENIKYMDRAFYNCSLLTKITFNSLKNVKGMYYTFYNCLKLNTLSSFDTSNSKNFDYTFYNCKELASINSIDTTSSESMIYTFYNCNSLISNLSLHTSKVKNMTRMLYNCSKIKTITYLDTSSAIDVMGLFEGCSSLISIPILDFSNVTSMQRVFYNCSSIKEITFANTENVINLLRTFYGCRALQTITGLNASNVQNMSYAFNDCRSLDTIVVDVSSATNLSYTFSSCSNLYTVKFDNSSTTKNVTNFSYAFSNCPKLINIPALDISSATNVNYIFSDCTNLSNMHLDSWTFETITNLSFIVRNCTSISDEDLQTIQSWTLSTITNINGLLQGLSITTFDVSNWNTSNVSTVNYLFANCKNLVTITGLDKLVLSNVKSLDNMFLNCSSLEELDVNDWDVSNVTSAQLFIYGCEALSVFNVTDWNTSKITTLYNAFNNCGLTVLDLSNWDLSSITNLQNMASNCKNLETVYINTNHETISEMSDMFTDCPKLVNLPDTLYLYGSCNNVFNNCTELTNINNLIITSNKTSSRIFNNCTKLESIGSLIINDSSSVEYMFNNCTNLTSINTLQINAIQEISLAYMFNYCTSLTSLNGITNDKIIDVNHMFYNCQNLTSLDLTNWQLQNCKDTSYWLYNCINLTSITVSDSWSVSSSEDMSYMFYNCKKIETIPFLDMDNCFYLTGILYNCILLKEIDNMQTKQFNSSKVINMDYAFSDCKELLYLPVLDTSSCTSLTRLFYNCIKMTGTANALSYWNRTPAISSHSECFYNCTSLDNYESEIPYGWKQSSNSVSASNINNENQVEVFNLNINNSSDNNKEKLEIEKQIKQLFRQIELLNQRIENIY